MKDEYHRQLHNHKLSGKYSGFRSINITGDWRAIFSEQDVKHGKVITKKVITFEYFGTHSQLYKG